MFKKDIKEMAEEAVVTYHSIRLDRLIKGPEIAARTEIPSGYLLKVSQVNQATVNLRMYLSIAPRRCIRDRETMLQAF
jgi:hypothetical protein